MGIALAGMMAVQICGTVPGIAAETEDRQGADLGSVQTETVEIGSDVWETPLIPDAAKALSGVSETEINLNETTGDGTWKFLYDIPDYTAEDGVPYPTEENQDFDFSAWSDRNWQNIIVPGEPLMQGFDILTNNEYYYQREITVPEDFKGNRVLVRFDGVYSNARVWINGKYIRTHVGGFTTWDCDITEYAAPGETVTMTVGVADIHSNVKGIWNPDGAALNNPSNATNYAHHNIGGILRDVSLVAVPYDYIARTYVETDFDENFVNADLEVTAQLGLVSGDAELSVELLDGETLVAEGILAFERESGELKNLPELVREATGLLEENGDNLYDDKTSGQPGQYSRETYEKLEQERDQALELLAESSELTEAQKITIPVEAPKQWDAEHPNLYTLRTTLTVDGEMVQVNEERIGFREIHYGGRDGTDVNKVYVNGKEVKLRGTCRHDVSDDLGRSMTREESYQEALAYKKANINFIRTSHYPASEHLLDACDELGIYVEQENAVCFQNPGLLIGKYEDFVVQFTEMIERDRNRASILIWSLGNESNYNEVKDKSGGNAFQTEHDYLKDVETTRPCIFSWPNTGESTDFADIYSEHYANVTGNMGRADKPRIHDEYAHIACYNLDELQRDVNVRNFWGESVKIGWENIFEDDGALGGALWGGIDDVFYIPDGTTERWQSHSSGQTAGYGEWGSVLDAYLREKPEAYLTKKAYSPVRVEEDSCYTEDGTLYVPVKNWFDHTDLNEVEVEFTSGETSGRIRIQESIAPHSQGIISVPGIDGSSNTVNLKFYTADGIMVDEYNVQLAAVQYSFAPAGSTPPQVTESEDELIVNGENFAMVFSKTTGLITSGTFGGEEGALLTGGPYLHITGINLGAYTKAGENGISWSESQDGTGVIVTLKGSYENGQGVQFDVGISGNGIITTDYTLTTAPAEGSYSEVGISYDIPSDMESVSWLRDGLYSAYPEDHIGRNEGTALKVREGAAEHPDQYGVEPSWSWKDDMKNYFVYATDDPNNGLVTNDFKTMRENVYYYNVNYGAGEDAPRISVESQDADVAARVQVSYDKAYVDDRDPSIRYEGGWDTYDSGSDYQGTETFSTALGAACEFTFTGTGVRFIGSKQANTGKAEVYIDGVFQQEVDTYSDLGTQLKQSLIYEIDGLEEGEHTIRLVTSGGNADCIVVDAFEVLNSGESGSKEKAQLIINNQWYYPNLSWGNYTGVAGSLAEGSQGTATIRLTNGSNFTSETIPSVSSVRIEEEEGGMLRASCEIRNTEEGMEPVYQWYRIAVGDPDSKAEPMEGQQAETLDKEGLSGYKVYCAVCLEKDGRQTEPVNSNIIDVDPDSYQIYDAVAETEGLQITGESGSDYTIDQGAAWTANAYGQSYLYLLDQAREAAVTFHFYGKGIRWTGATEANQGIAEVIVDGEDPVKVDLFNANVSHSGQYSEVLFEKTWEEAGDHQITVRWTGEKNENATASNVCVDAFIVLGGEAAAANVLSTEEEQAADPVAAEADPRTEEDGEAQSISGETDALKGGICGDLLQAVKAAPAILRAAERSEIDTAIEELSQAIADFKASRIDGIPVESISLDVTELSLKIGEEAKLTVTVTPTDATDQAVTSGSRRNGDYSGVCRRRSPGILQGNSC